MIFSKKKKCSKIYALDSSQKNFQSPTTPGSAGVRKNVRDPPLRRGFGIPFFNCKGSSFSLETGYGKCIDSDLNTNSGSKYRTFFWEGKCSGKYFFVFDVTYIWLEKYFSYGISNKKLQQHSINSDLSHRLTSFFFQQNISVNNMVRRDIFFESFELQLCPHL